jgi:hypothetical protein
MYVPDRIPNPVKSRALAELNRPMRLGAATGAPVASTNEHGYRIVTLVMPVASKTERPSAGHKSYAGLWEIDASAGEFLALMDFAFQNAHPDTASQLSPEAQSVPLHARLIRAKAALGLSSTELAAVLKCARSALYNYLDKTYTSQVKDETLRRLGQLEDLAEFWVKLQVGAPGHHLHTAVVPTKDGTKTSLFALLTADQLDNAAIRIALDAVARHCADDLKEAARTDDLIARGFGS